MSNKTFQGDISNNDVYNAPTKRFAKKKKEKKKLWCYETSLTWWRHDVGDVAWRRHAGKFRLSTELQQQKQRVSDKNKNDVKDLNNEIITSTRLLWHIYMNYCVRRWLCRWVERYRLCVCSVGFFKHQTQTV